MNTEPLERKLAAILYADVAGYSRLTSEDEEGTHRALGACLDTFATSIKKHNGKVLHYAGDAVLAEFASVVNALTCAVAIQRDLRASSEHLPDERKIQFRIGINLGDVIVDRDEIYGDGVNVAARLETLAMPGGICISESVRTAIGNKLPLEYEFLGDQKVKNIAEPVKTYCVQLERQAARTATTKSRRLSRRLVVGSVAGIILAAVAGVVVWLKPWTSATESPSDERMVLPWPDKPSIAVLPFANMSDDPKQEYFAEGMSEDLITDLSKLSGLFVIARNSTFRYKGKSVDVRQVANELGVRFVLEGSVRRADDQVRVNAQLVDATTGGHLWAERYDGELSDVFALQDKVTSQVIDALAIVLTPAEEAHRSMSETPSSEAYDAFLKGWAHYLRRTPHHYASARDYFETAIELDPHFTRAYAALASVYWKSYFEEWYPALKIDRDTAKARAGEYLDVAMSNPTSLAYQVKAYMHLWRGRWEEAVATGQRAIYRDPNDADSYVTLAEMLIYAGKARQALDMIVKARRLDPHNEGYHAYLSGLSQFGLEQFDVAAASMERALELSPERWMLRDEFGPQFCLPCRPLAATYAYLGREQEAKALVQQISQQHPNANVQTDVAAFPFQHDVDRERLARGLVEAGLPENLSDVQ